MKTINHDGKEYILKEDVDGLVRERLSKITESKRQLESRTELLSNQLQEMETKVKNSDAMASQIAQLQDELSISHKKYERHSAIAQHGITDSRIRDLVEWQYSKSMESKAKKDQVNLSTWLENMKNEGEVPLLLQPYIGANAPTTEAQAPTTEAQAPTTEAQAPTTEAQAPTTEAQAPGLTASTLSRPTTNKSVAAVADSGTNASMLKKATDYDYFRANRSEIKKRYYQQRSKRLRR